MKVFRETDMQDIDIYNEIKDFVLELYKDDERTRNDIVKDDFVYDKLIETKKLLENNKTELLMNQINNYSIFNHIRSDLEVGLSTGIDNDIVDQLKAGLEEVLENINSGNAEVSMINESIETIDTLTEKMGF